MVSDEIQGGQGAGPVQPTRKLMSSVTITGYDEAGPPPTIEVSCDADRWSWVSVQVTRCGVSSTIDIPRNMVDQVCAAMVFCRVK